MGLLDEVNKEENKRILTTKKLKSLVEDVLFNKPMYAAPSVTLYTGMGGLIAFDWCMAGIQGYIPCRDWVHHNRRSRGYHVSLITKHGNLKALIKYSEPKKVSLRLGTEEIFTTNDLSELAPYIEIVKLYPNITVEHLKKLVA